MVSWNDKLFVLTWVADLVIAGNSKEINKLKYSLESMFKIKKQPTESRSFFEAEHQGLVAVVQEAIAFCDLPRELGYEQFEPATIGEDNQSCINFAFNPLLQKRSKHIDTKYHFKNSRKKLPYLSKTHNRKNESTLKTANNK